MTDTPEAAPPPADAGWSVTLGDTTYPLVPSAAALVTIERATERTIFSMTEQLRGDTLTISEVAMIALALIGAGLPANSADPILRDYTALRAGLGVVSVDRMAAVVVGAGLLPVTAAIAGPLSAALAGKTDAAGARKAD